MQIRSIALRVRLSYQLTGHVIVLMFSLFSVIPTHSQERSKSTSDAGAGIVTNKSVSNESLNTELRYPFKLKFRANLRLTFTRGYPIL